MTDDLNSTMNGHMAPLHVAVAHYEGGRRVAFPLHMMETIEFLADSNQPNPEGSTEHTPHEEPGK